MMRRDSSDRWIPFPFSSTPPADHWDNPLNTTTTTIATTLVPQA